MSGERPWWQRLDGVPPGMAGRITTTHQVFAEHPVGRPHHVVRFVVGAALGLAYGLIAAPGGALAIAGLAIFIWAFTQALRDVTPQNWRQTRALTHAMPMSGGTNGRALAYVYMAKVAMPFAIVSSATALVRIAAGHPVNHQ